MHTHNHSDHEHAHTHDHDHSHHHSHGKQPIYLYGLGVILYLLGLFVPMATIIANLLFVVAMLTAGYHVILEGFGETMTDSLQARKFKPNIHLLMTLAALGASIIGDFDEGALLILIFAGAHFLEEYAEGKSRREITQLLKLNPTQARLVLPSGESKTVSVETLQVGDVLKVLPGDQVPTDGRVLEGVSVIDESSINGESMPREKNVGDEVYGSTVNGQGTFMMEVTKKSTETVFAKIIQLVNQSQSNLSKTATQIKRLEPYYVKVVLTIVPLFILATPFLLGWDWSTSFYRGMVLLIATSPCALAASAVPATLSGISNLAKRGVLFKGGSYLANLATIKAVAFDKTGTLTAGTPVVTDTYFVDGVAADQYVPLIIAMEKNANHPLANAMLQKFGQATTVTIAVENEIGKGLVTTYQGQTYRLGKPSLFPNVTAEVAQQTKRWMNEGKTVIYFAKAEQVLALFGFMDVSNPQAQPVIAYLKAQKIQPVMITGDAEATGVAVAQTLGIEEVRANVLPENKAQIIQELQAKYGATVMVGDGVNDAPALVQADIGFAMGEGTDIAIDVADAVIMQNDLRRFSYAHQLSKKLTRIVWENITFSMFVVLLLTSLNFLGKMDIGISVLAHEGSTLLVIVNGLRLLLPIKEK
jgi:ATPase, P-type (transporting), HAD superfamily, subfamily IC/heavy metal translocating P-type ATPase